MMCIRLADSSDFALAVGEPLGSLQRGRATSSLIRLFVPSPPSARSSHWLRFGWRAVVRSLHCYPSLAWNLAIRMHADGRIEQEGVGVEKGGGWLSASFCTSCMQACMHACMYACLCYMLGHFAKGRNIQYIWRSSRNAPSEGR